jgi:Ca2+-binding EF-hand superfamily protein
MKALDSKSVPLSNQNIPFMMEKYGINRAEAYVLFSLYRSLEKVSELRTLQNSSPQQFREPGIDRSTFDEFIKGLEINCGDELIRHICYSSNAVTWQEFLKIVSIGIRKTPKSRLEAILEGLGGRGQKSLTMEQINVMVGSSLRKLLGRDEPELRKYFVNSVIKQMDSNKSGSV